ncbi:hypothetical protein BDV37DRAFT_237471 [Aspergillus pseudonomiae]|uniref:N-acetylgalactosaminide beta-1,3-galactosyltransferase n=1 Tax=Aspergillus pseudonomiae TaxID=1506151 RepID=A0A5N7DRE6_9EURO|nr:uncharacterized protein BDV37DRAFT_237471 [Aspergillus pseudonomiae]KAE8408865.1 hypothetical protein BDV37DRAFT_237471 [Aspergillus pseudonomiae]
MARVLFHRENRIVPLGIMIFVLFLFFYHLDLEHNDPVIVHGLPDLPQDLSSRQSPLKEESKQQPLPSAQPSPSAVPVAPLTPSSDEQEPSTRAQERPKPKQKPKKQPKQYGQLSPDDVVLLFKTGASVLWRRLPIHLSTSFEPSRIPADNVIIYSDYPETIGSWQVIDVLENSTETVLKTDNYEPYRQQPDYEARQVYAEMANVEGDGNGPAGGWKLDKYKFLPLIQHAGRAKPDAKWYIYIEDDGYIFLPNLLLHLEKFSWQEPWYFGGLAWKHGDYFAHGGAGFVLSRGAWEQSFGLEEDMVTKYADFTEAHGCGDHVLGHVMQDYGINFGQIHGKSEYSWGFNPEPHWGGWFRRASWCYPLYSWHHTHSKDVARLYNFEQSWDFEKKGQMRYRDFFKAMIEPYMRRRVEWWDNQSSRYELRSDNVADAQPPEGVSKQIWHGAWKSVDACEAACVAWEGCVQWTFYEDQCRMDENFMLGMGIPVGDLRRQTSLPRTSGWLPQRAEKWVCDA